MSRLACDPALKVVGTPRRTAIGRRAWLHPRGRPFEQEVPTVLHGMRCAARLADRVVAIEGVVIWGNGLERLSGRTTICRNAPSHIMSPTTGSQPGSSTEVSLGVRGHTPSLQRAHAPPPGHQAPTQLTNFTLDNPPPGQVSRGAEPAVEGPASRRMRVSRSCAQRVPQLRRSSGMSAPARALPEQGLENTGCAWLGLAGQRLSQLNDVPFWVDNVAVP
jgi:hypothetical protein